MENTKKNTALNVLGVFASIILSILFVVMAFVVPVYYSVAGMLQPKAITTVVQNIDYVEVFKESDGTKELLEGLGLESEKVDEIIKSKEVGGLLKDCTDKITTLLLDGDASLEEFDASFLQGLVDEHIDGILTVAEDQFGTTIEKEQIKEELDMVIDSSKEAIEQTVMELQPVKETIVTYQPVSDAVQNSLKWYSIAAVILVEVLFLGLIYLMRKRNYGGFIWIAVNTGIAGALVSAVALLVGSGMVKELVATLPSFANGIAVAAVGSATTKLIIALVTCFVIMAAAITACVLLRKKKGGEVLAAEPDEAAEV